MQRDFRMADPGKPFQVTDVITDETLPWRRLILAGVGGDNGAARRCFVFYEQGGFGRSTQLLIFDIPANNKTARLLWRGYGGPQPERASVNAIRNALARGEFN